MGRRTSFTKEIGDKIITLMADGKSLRDIAEQSGIRMPSFFGYMLYSMVILIPIFAIISLAFFMG